MILRPYILHPEWLGSDRVVALRDHVKLFFIKIGNVTDGAGRFEADAALLRAALYPKELHKVSERDVKGMLEQIHLAGLVRLYTRAGKGFGEVAIYKQKDSMRKVRFPGPDAGELNFSGSDGGDDPPPRRPKKSNRIEGRGSAGEAPAALPAPSSDLAAPAQACAMPQASAAVVASEGHEAWLARMQAAWPDLNMQAELAKAHAKKAKQGGQLERRWFEEVWLPGCSVVITRADVFSAKQDEGAQVVPIEGPDGWKEAVDGTALGEAVREGEIVAWSELNKAQKAFVLERLEKRRASA